MKGFFLVHRGWRDNPLFAGEKFSRADAWLWLIETAVFKSTKIEVAGKLLHLKRGQLSYSTRYMGKAWGWSEAKVRRFLGRLKTDAMIVVSTDAGQSLVTISNYEKYQDGHAKSDAPENETATQERRSSDANKKEGNEGNSSSLEEEGGKTAFWNLASSLAEKAGKQEKSVRSLMGRLLNNCDGDTERATEIISLAIEKFEPISYIGEIIKRLKNPPPKDDARLANGPCPLTPAAADYLDSLNPNILSPETEEYLAGLEGKNFE